MINKLNEQGYYLTTEQQVGLGISAANDFFSIVPTIASGASAKQSADFNAWQLNMNAEMLRADSQDMLNRSRDYMNKVRIEGKKVKGEQKAAMSASGFEVSSRSYEEILENTDYNTAKNASAIRRSAMDKYSSEQAKASLTDIQADYERAAGKIAKKRARNDAVMSGIVGALKLGAMGYFQEPENMGRDKTGLAPIPARKA